MKVESRFANRGGAVLFLLLSLLAFTACQAQVSQRDLVPLDQFPRGTLEIRQEGRTHKFDIWIAETPQQQAQGLMFVRDLPENRGMLFIAKEPRVFSMWMMNTYIPLDMVFIGTDGRIRKIVANTKPHSLATVSSDDPVKAIVELKGGEAARRSLKVGDRVTWKEIA
jgi:uncharacterized membrane protein (UPF0127 family)